MKMIFWSSSFNKQDGSLEDKITTNYKLRTINYFCPFVGIFSFAWNLVQWVINLTYLQSKKYKLWILERNFINML
jgi:hypothetical protein